MRLRFDQLGKQIGKEALTPSGLTIAHDEIAHDAQQADLRHEPDPSREAERVRLGLLGRFAATVCLIELYGHPPDKDEVLACVGKLIAFRQKRVRLARARTTSAPFAEPFLWIIAAGRPTTVLAELGTLPAPDWPAGVYLAPSLLRTGLVVASELPRERSTVLVRLMVAGPLLSRAIADLSALPADAHERAFAEPILLNLRHVLGTEPTRTSEEQEFIVTMQEYWKQARQELLDAGRDAGRAEEAARAVLTVLRVRGIAVPDSARERILAQKDPSLLERWHEKAIVASSITEVLDEPS
ncbi:Hypothetical protein A7982_00376 [Minicystis rosea]|nr:Hypothetical protein A7982_00376 [Minicystis rosea]